MYIRTLAIDTAGGSIRTTPYIVSRWIKAAFLIVLGIVILLFADKLVQDLRTNAEGHFDLAFEWTWSLITWLLWILVAWLFVDAVLTIVLSRTQQRHTIGDVSKRLERIERKLGIQESEGEEDATVSEVEASADESAGDVQPLAEEPPPPT